MKITRNLDRTGWVHGQPTNEIDPVQVTLCIAILKDNFQPAAATHRHSYELKHLVERAVGTYISNGAIIKAAMELGYKPVKFSGLNCEFKMKKLKTSTIK